MSFHVEITANAKAEMLEAYLWIVERSRASAERWLDGLMATINALRDKPARCPLAPESDAFEQPVRQLLYGKRGGVYRILFQIQGNTVFILHVRHAAREWIAP